MCEHKNLRTVGDRLFCKDCKQELPLEFLLNQCKPEEPDVVMAADAVVIEPAVDVIPAEEPVEPAEPEEPAQEAPQEEQDKGGNAPVSEEPANDTPKKKPAKTGRKTAKKGA